VLPIKRIMCPTDFSDYSYQALKVADELAGHFSAELLIVHVVGPIPIAPVMPGMASSTFNVARYRKELETSSLNSMRGIAGDLATNAPTVRTVVGHGQAADEIVNLMESEQVDLTVISTHGMSGLERIFFGSVAEKIVRNSRRPVLTVRAFREKTESGKQR
jgi:nucleotide-binding universal stress UspA family protein